MGGRSRLDGCLFMPSAGSGWLVRFRVELVSRTQCLRIAPRRGSLAWRASVQCRVAGLSSKAALGEM